MFTCKLIHLVCVFSAVFSNWVGVFLDGFSNYLGGDGQSRVLNAL